MTLAKPEQAAGRGDAKTLRAPLFLIDGHSLTFKAYYGIRNRLTAPNGMPTGAVYGFLRMLLKIIEDRRPQYMAVIFDTGKPTFREALYEAYKANRESPPPDFGLQMEWILKLLKSMGICVFSRDGFEADDLIATMARARADAGDLAVIVTADKDLFQLVDGNVKLLRFGSQAPELDEYDADAVERKMGVRPSQIADWLALVGDSSDNIPGVPSIGAKGAAKLLQEYGTLDNLLARAAEISSERTRNALLENADKARLSRRLATVDCCVEFDWDMASLALPPTLWNEQSIRVLGELGFNSILKERGVEGLKPAETIQPDETIETDYRLVTSAEELRAWAAEAVKARTLALDTETTDTDPMTARLVGISLSFRQGHAIYIPVGHRVGIGGNSPQIPLAVVREILAPVLGEGRPGPALSAHHAKYDWKILERAGFRLRPPAFDTMVASFVLDPGRASGHGLKAMAMEYCRLPMTMIDDLIGRGKNMITMAEVTPEDAREYACRDADATLRLTECLSAKLDETPTLRKLFDEIEMPLIPVLHKLEMGGFAVEPAQLRRLSGIMSAELHRLNQEIWAAAGRQFNVDSPRQVAQVLFEELGLPSQRKTKTGLSTDNEVLEALAPKHPIAQLILDCRAIAKLKGTYADQLPKLIHPETGRIHTSFNMTVAQTGRLSSNNPNLQNIPIRSELGREIRRAFIPDRPDHELLAADYSQIELRILAHFTGDEALRDAYAHGRDIHRLTASRVFGVLEADVTGEMRDKAKVINFGIIYGMSAHGLSQRLGIGRAEAGQFIQAYFDGYPRVRRWIDELLEQARAVGYVETLMGRRRLLPDLTAKNGQLRSVAERIAVNTPIQGTCADMIKLAMIQIDAEIADELPGARMVCQVHDELVFSVPKPLLEQAADFVRSRMCGALPLDVPVVTDVSTGACWSDC